MPDCYRSEDPVQSYRKYYAYKTTYMKVVWSKLGINLPKWWTDDFVKESINLYNVNTLALAIG
jgi:hypothetical protein